MTARVESRPRAKKHDARHSPPGDVAGSLNVNKTMALPAELQPYDALIEFLVEALVREIEADEADRQQAVCENNKSLKLGMDL